MRFDEPGEDGCSVDRATPRRTASRSLMSPQPILSLAFLILLRWLQVRMCGELRFKLWRVLEIDSFFLFPEGKRGLWSSLATPQSGSNKMLRDTGYCVIIVGLGVTVSDPLGSAPSAIRCQVMSPQGNALSKVRLSSSGLWEPYNTRSPHRSAQLIFPKPPF